MTVFIAKENKDTKQAIRRIIEHFKDNLDLSKGVFLKPNIVFPVKERSGQITRHKVVKGVIEVLREIEPKVDIVVGDGTAAGSDPQENFRVSGYTDLAKELNVPLLDLNQAERETIKWKYGKIKLPKIIFEKTYINLPILKKSSAAGISGAMKNQKGLLEDNMKKVFHKLGLHGPIAQLNETIQPILTILDGNRSLNENALIGGDSPYEIDSLLTNLLGVNDPEYIQISRKQGRSCERLRVLGDDLGEVKGKSWKKDSPYKSLFRFRVWSNPRTCSMCRYVLSSVKTFRKNNKGYNFFLKFRLFIYAIRGAELVFGLKPQFEHKYSTVICLGDCTAKLAKEKGYLHIPGCPPTRDDMLKYL